jgi:hypothetical protein
MKLNFLCDSHRAWLRNDPDAAAATWLRSYDCALELLQEGEYMPAIRHAGSAAETAEILLLELDIPGARGINRYTEAAVLLAELLQRVGEKTAARAGIACAVNTPQRLVASGMERSTLLSGCERLMRLGDQVTSASVTQARPGGPRARALSWRLH